jgi:hypothetical protein
MSLFKSGNRGVEPIPEKRFALPVNAFLADIIVRSLCTFARFP